MKLFFKDKRTRIFLGDRFESDLGILFDKNQLKNKSIILITGVKSFVESKYYGQLKNVLKLNNINIVKRLKIHSNPIETEVLNLVPKANQKFDFILAVGGGSVIDVGKLLKYHFNRDAKLIAIYTLPGSATVVTPFAVFNNQEFKVGLASDLLIPDFSYVNTELIENIGIDQKLIASADIFAHAVESFYSKASSFFSRIKAKRALKILTSQKSEGFSILPLIKSDIQAGLSESVGLVLFPHAAGHYLTYKMNIPHGVATMYFLPEYLRLLFNKGVNIDSEHIKYAEKLQLSLIDMGIMPKINLSESDILKLFNLTHKYMDFAYLNSPIKITEQEYALILKI